MQEIELASTRRRTTRLGYGCAALMGATSRRDSLALLETAFDAGIRHFDVAPMYGFGAAEGLLGDFMERHPGDITITTKFGIPPAHNQWLLNAARSIARPLLRLAPAIKSKLAGAANSVAGTGAKSSFTAAEARFSLERSLRQLRCEYIDLFLLHEATVSDLNDEALLRFLQDAVASGKIGAFGIGSAAVEIPALLQHKPSYCDVLQYEWSILHPSPDPGTAFTIHHRALGDGFRALHAALLDDPALCLRWSGLVQADLGFTETLGKLMLKASFMQNSGSLILASSRNPTHIRENVAILEDASLAASATRLHDLVRNEAAPLGSGLTMPLPSGL